MDDSVIGKSVKGRTDKIERWAGRNYYIGGQWVPADSVEIIDEETEQQKPKRTRQAKAKQ